MKKIRWIILLALAVLLCIPSGAVIAKNGSVCGYNMFSLNFVNKQEGWACGDDGAVYHTSDGGYNWEKQIVKTDQPLASISFCNAQVGWVVGDAGTIFHTVDGGKTWERQAAPRNTYLLAVRALGPQKCWAAGDWGTILYTGDGGKTWQDRSYPKDMVIYSIDFVGKSEGWMACEFGKILHTEDGGRNWTVQETGIHSALFGVSFSSDQNGVAVGLDGVIIHTADGGNTWQQVSGPKKSGVMQSGFYKGTRSLYNVRMKGQLGVAVGDRGRIAISKDGGNTWQYIQIPLDMSLFWFTGVYLSNPGAIITGSRSIVVLTDGGKVKAVGFLPKIR